jgi:hypothetical protein
MAACGEFVVTAYRYPVGSALAEHFLFKAGSSPWKKRSTKVEPTV